MPSAAPEPDPGRPLQRGSKKGPSRAALAEALHWSRANTGYLATLLVGVVVVLVGGWAAGEVYEEVVAYDGVAIFDQPVLDAVVAHRMPWLNSIASTLAVVGGSVGWTIITIALALALSRAMRSWVPVVLFASATAASVTMTVLGKRFADRVRPPHELAIPPFEYSPSFPSGHTLNTTVVVLVTAYLVTLLGRSVRVGVSAFALALFFAAAMGLSRVYLGAHWLTDVIAGWLLGAASAAVVVIAHQVWLLRRQGLELSSAARPASSRATGTRNGEQDT